MPHDGRPTFVRRAGWIALVVLGGLLAACSSTASVAPSSAALASTLPALSPVTTSSQPPSPVASKGPATAKFAIVGSAGLTGPVTTQSITCGRPSLGGPQIFYLGQAASGPQIVIFLMAGHAEVRVGTGSAATLKLRTYVGSGVTNFDAASGATLNTTLTETTTAGTAIGKLGALSSISGTINCGSQQQGSATIVLSGLTPQGQLAGALTSVEVTCTLVGSVEYVGVVGLGLAGTTPVLAFVTGSTGISTVTVENGSTSSSYQSNAPAFTTLVAGGATMAGDLAEQLPAGATPSPYSVHVMGSATCGSTVQQ
jgi:hypothetical protein